MDLTNKPQENSEQSISLSKYLGQEEKRCVFKCQISCRSDTQLLESSPIHENSSFCISSEQSIQRPFILKSDRQNSRFSDLGTDFQIYANAQKLRENAQISDDKIPLEKLCKELLIVVKSLQEKIQKNHEKSEQQTSQFSKRSSNVLKGSFLDSLGKSSGTSCSTEQQKKGTSCNNRDNFMVILSQLIQTKGQIKVYQQQNQKYHKELLDVKFQNQLLKTSVRKNQTQCMKLRQLLKQYKVYHKNKLVQEQKSSKNDLQNSLEKRLNHFQQQQRSQRKFVESSLFDSIQTVVSKEFPKTPNHFRYHSCNNFMNSMKTKERPQHRSPGGVLKQIFQFQERIQRQNIESTKRQKTENCKKSTYKNSNNFGKYPFNYLLEQDDNDKQQISDIFQLDHFSTMESLPESHHELPSQENKKMKLDEKGKMSLRKTKLVKNFQQLC